MDGVEHIFQGVGRMGIVDNSRHTLFGTDGFQSAGHTLQCAEDYEDVFGLLAQHDGSTVDSQQV